MPLTAKQARFVAEYQVDLNATQAAIRAGYSEHTAMQQGSRLLSKVEIRQAVEQTQQAVTKAVLDSAEDVLRDAIATYRAAHAAEQYGAAVSALNLRAKRYPGVFAPESGASTEQHLHLHGLDDEQLRMIAGALSRPS